MRRFAASALALLLLVFSVSPAFAAAPTLDVSAPADNVTVTGSQVEVRFAVGEFTFAPSTVPLADYGKRPDLNKANEGHLHLTLDLLPLVVWDKTTPYTFTNVPPGEHQLTVEIANNDHSSLSPAVLKTIRFKTVAGDTAPTNLPRTGAPDASNGLLLLAVAALMGGVALRFAFARRAS